MCVFCCFVLSNLNFSFKLLLKLWSVLFHLSTYLSLPCSPSLIKLCLFLYDFCLSVHLFNPFLSCVFVHLLLCQSVYLSISPWPFLKSYNNIYILFCRSVYLSINPSVCLFDTKSLEMDEFTNLFLIQLFYIKFKLKLFFKWFRKEYFLT